MAVLSFSDLLSQKRQVRKGLVEVEGLGNVELHELSAADNEALQAQMQGKEDDEVKDIIVDWAAKMVKGDTATADEVQQLKAVYSYDQLIKIYLAGLQFNGETIKALEDIEKN